MFARNLPKNVLFAHLALLTANLIWAAAGPIIKLTLEFIPPITFLFVRLLLVSIIILPFTIYLIRKNPVDKNDWVGLFMLGVFSQTAIVLAFLALKYTTVLDYTIIGVIGAILTVYAGHYFYKEKVDQNIKIGMVLASIGTFIVVLEPIFAGDTSALSMRHRIFGNFLGLLYSICWVMYVVWSKMSMGEKSAALKRSLRFIKIKPMKKKYPPVLIASITFYVGMITLAPFAFIERLTNTAAEYTSFDLLNLNGQTVLGILYMVILSSIVAYMLCQWAWEYAKVADTALYGYLQPVLTFPFAFLLLKEIPNIYTILGTIVIATGVIIAERTYKP